MKFSEYFGLAKTQAELDFVDVDTSKDTRLFIDPYAIEIRRDQLSEELKEHIISFFSSLLESVQKGDQIRAKDLTSVLSEPDETYLGMSRGTPAGRGVGRFQADQIISALRGSSAFKSGLLQDLAESELFIDGISSDKISDLTTNIIRMPLVRYTQHQCNLHGIPLTPGVALPPIWNPDEERWESKYHDLPIVAGRPVLLVPKTLVRRRLSLDSQEFYNHHMLSYLRAEYESANSALVRLLKNGKRTVYKKDVREKHPFSKDALADFARSHPKILDVYKDIKGATGPLDPKDLDEEFEETAFANALISNLEHIDVGAVAAGEYHSYIMGVLTFLFYPALIYPKKEHEIHEGRKRIDILFVNAARSGFFYRRLETPQTRAVNVFVECKNYATDIRNPELDQMAGRFGHQRGQFGIIVCRNIDDRQLMTKRCRDAANDGRGYILVLDDQDIVAMCRLVADGQRKLIDAFLEQKFQELL